MSCRLDTYGDFCEGDCLICQEEKERRKAGESGDANKRGTLLMPDELEAARKAKAKRDGNERG